MKDKMPSNQNKIDLGDLDISINITVPSSRENILPLGVSRESVFINKVPEVVMPMQWSAIEIDLRGRDGQLVTVTVDNEMAQQRLVGMLEGSNWFMAEVGISDGVRVKIFYLLNIRFIACV